MSFDIKYDRNGKVITPEPVATPEFAQVTNFEPAEVDVEPETVQEQESPEQVEFIETESNEVEQPSVAPRPALKEGDKARNLRILRERADRAERAERERDELARRLLEMEDRNRKNQTQHEPEEDLTVNVGEDDLAEGKHVNKLTKKIRQLEEKIEQSQRQAAEMAIENRIKSKYNDFDAVVSKDNIEELKLRYPELSQTLNNATDLYSQAVSAYTLIKELGIHTEDAFVQNKATVQKNASKPRPLTSIAPQQGETALSRANAFASGEMTKELKDREWAEMQRIIRAG